MNTPEQMGSHEKKMQKLKQGSMDEFIEVEEAKAPENVSFNQ